MGLGCLGVGRGSAHSPTETTSTIARTLRAVTGAVNNDKGEKDPSNWLPPDPDAVCTYLADWTAIKARWGLSMDQSEAGRIRNVLTDRCPGQLDRAVARRTRRHPSPDHGPPTPPPPIQPAHPAGSRPSNCDPAYPTRVHPAVATRPRLRRHPLPALHRPPPDLTASATPHDGVGCDGSVATHGDRPRATR